MGEKDFFEKKLEQFDDVFADIINNLVFGGRRVIHESDLEPGMPRSGRKYKGSFFEQERDCVKYWKNHDIRLAMFGMENQTADDDDYVIRCISYDGAEYRDQYRNRQKIKKKNTEIRKRNTEALQRNPDAKEEELLDIPAYYPVITIGLYFSDKRWSGSGNIRDVLKVPEGLEEFIPDYDVKIFDIAYLSDEEVAGFQSDFRYVAEYFVESRRQAEGQEPRFRFSLEYIHHLHEFLDLMSSLTGNNRFLEEEETIVEEIKEEKTMITIIDRYEARGEARGLAIGEIRGAIKTYHDEMNLMPTEIINKIMVRFDLEKDEAERYVEETI